MNGDDSRSRGSDTLRPRRGYWKLCPYLRRSLFGRPPRAEAKLIPSTHRLHGHSRKESMCEGENIEIYIIKIDSLFSQGKFFPPRYYLFSLLISECAKSKSKESLCSTLDIHSLHQQSNTLGKQRMTSIVAHNLQRFWNNSGNFSPQLFLRDVNERQ